MCGVFGSSDREKFLTLYKLNKERGNFCFSFTGILFWDKDNPYIDKISLTPDNIDSIVTADADYYLGHTQSPTGIQRSWTEQTSHPFRCGDYLVSHNGILSNFEQLKQKYLPNHTNPVDSSIIPALLNFYEQDEKNIFIEDIISKTAEQLEGTFGCWIYHILTGRIFLIRCSSTIYADKKGNFSSVQFDDSYLLDEGIVHEIECNHFVQKAVFKYNSPFFTL